jgi:hypothetical protein
VQFLGLRRRVGAQFLAQPVAQRRVGKQRPGGLAGLSDRRHEPAAGRLVKRVVGRSRLCVAGGGIRVARGERGLRRGEPGAAQQDAQLRPGRVRPGRVGLVGKYRSRGKQFGGVPGGGQRGRRDGRQPQFRVLAVPRGGVEVHADPRLARQPVPIPAAADHPGAKHRAEPADERRHGLSRVRGRRVCRGPHHIGDPVGGKQPLSFHREQF